MSQINCEMGRILQLTFRTPKTNKAIPSATSHNLRNHTSTPAKLPVGQALSNGIFLSL